MPASRPRDIGDAIQGAALIALHILLGPIFRGWRTRWGATRGELERFYPGDDLIPSPRWEFTHAVSIHASAAQVWPWVIQIGQGRGGFYSYELLENLIGCGIHNVDRIVLEFQKLGAGDSVRLHQKIPPLPVLSVRPRRSLLIGGAPDYDDPSGKYAGGFWLFYLYEKRRGVTRLISHGRNDYGPRLGLAGKLVFGPALMEPITFVMGRKMLLTIKKLAEGEAK